MSEYKSAVNEFCHKGDQGVGHFLEGDIDSRSCKNSFVCFFFFRLEKLSCLYVNRSDPVVRGGK